MKKRILTILAIVFFGVAVYLVYVGVTSGRVEKIDREKLEGTILLQNKDLSQGLSIFNPTNGESILVLEKYYCLMAIFSPDKNKIFFLNGLSKPTRNDYAIYEYNLASKALTPLVKYRDASPPGYHDLPDASNFYYSLENVSGKNAISYSWGEKIFMVDLDSKKETVISEGKYKFYSWAEDDKTLLYYNSDDDFIHKRYFDKNKDEKLWDGCRPVSSKNNSYIAFVRELKGDKNELVVKEINSGEEWTYVKSEWINDYVFSPNESYILIEEYKPKVLGLRSAQRIKAWDFKNNKFLTIFDTYPDTSLDWK